ncbi:hypothetical protein FB451DRAFT_1251570 [Mycena latifolia]|nr:hypothetical protein FB451DRAFT_1251570 [Mycena latifolia]
MVDRESEDLVDRDDDAEEMPSIRDWLDEDDKIHINRKLSTLNPAYLQPTDYISLSHMPSPSISFVPHTESFQIQFFKKDSRWEPFPKGTRGFLYYHARPHLPPMAGGVRFRITPSIHPSSFSDGFDLLRGSLPWEIPLHTITSAVGRKTVLRDQLLIEGLVTQEDLDWCHTITPNKKRLDSRIALYTLNQPFPVAFRRGLHAWIIGKTEAQPWTYTYMFTDNRREFRPLVRPYSGHALAQFELSSLREHAGTTTVVMRIVKMLTPPTCVLPDYDGYVPPPAEGELVYRPMGHSRAARLQPWFCDVAGPSDSAAALRTLVENTRALGT